MRGVKSETEQKWRLDNGDEKKTICMILWMTFGGEIWKSFIPSESSRQTEFVDWLYAA
jgi:hypothetical protein